MGNKAESNTFRVEWSPENGAFVARCLEYPGLGVHAGSREAALLGAKIAVEELLEWPLGNEELHPRYWD